MHPDYLNNIKKNSAWEIIIDKLTLQGRSCGFVYIAECKLPHKSKELWATQPLQIVHTDLDDIAGLLGVTSYNGKRWMLTFVDEFTSFVTVYLLENKSEVFSKFKSYEAQVTNHFNRGICELRSDNGPEYRNSAFESFCDSKGITMGHTVPFCSPMNGRAKRFNRSIMDKARTVLLQSKLDLKFWSEAVLYSVFCINRTLNFRDKLPAKLWYGRDVDYNKFHVFGCNAYAFIPEEKRKSKLEAQSKILKFVGCNREGYRLLNLETRKIEVSRDVRFDEKSMVSNLTEEENSPHNGDEVDGNSSRNNQSVEHNVTLDPNSASHIDLNSIDNIVIEESEDVCRIIYSVVNDCPRNVDEARNSPNWPKWKSAMETELQAIRKADTWTLVPRTDDIQTVSTRWVFKVKEDIHGQAFYKARLVVRGFEIPKVFDFKEIYAPVAKLSTVRLLVSMALNLGLHCSQLDIKNAYLNSYLEDGDNVFIEIPPGVICNVRNHILKLKKALYGLNQAPLAWNKRINKFVLSFGFVRSLFDECLYSRVTEGCRTFILIYVDDVLLCSSDINVIVKLKAQILKEFEGRDLGNLKSFLGIDFEFNDRRLEVRLNQSKLIKRVCERFNVKCRSCTPIEDKLSLCNVIGEAELRDNCYKELLGCLMYVMLGTRPDICFSVSYFSQFQNDARRVHFNHLLRVLKYLYSTMNFKLVYRKLPELFKAYVDADWANCPATRRSVTGFCIFVYDNLILWRSKKQSIVTVSTTDSETVALMECVVESLNIKNLFTDLKIDRLEPLLIYEDNSNCVDFANNNNKRSKHVDVKYFYIRELVSNGRICVRYIESKNQIADVFTKAVPRIKFEAFRAKLNLCDI